MRLFPLNKALLWKEWKQNRWLFWVGMVVLNFNPILVTLLKAIAGWLDPFRHDPNLYNWVPLYLSNTGNIPMFQLGVLAAPVLGGALLGQERGFANSIEFLAATSVSRREILWAKYLTGLKMVWLVIGVNLLFVYLMAIFFPSVNNWYGLIGMYVARGSALTAIFSLCFALSTLFGNFYSAVFGSLVAIFSPPVILQMFDSFQGRFWIFIHPDWYRWAEHLYLPFYVMDQSAADANYVIPAMLLLSFLFYLMAVKLFDHNPFEKNGRLLMFGDVWKLVKWVIPLLVAAYAASKQFAVPKMLLVFVMMFGGLFVVVILLQRLIRNLGMR